MRDVGWYYIQIVSEHPCFCPTRDLLFIYSYSSLSGKNQARVNLSHISAVRAEHSDS